MDQGSSSDVLLTDFNKTQWKEGTWAQTRNVQPVKGHLFFNIVRTSENIVFFKTLYK